MTDTIYTAPQSELVRAVPAEQRGSLERGMAGDYPFSIRAILSEAWQKTHGAKLTLNLASGLSLVLYIGVTMLGGIAGVLIGGLLGSVATGMPMVIASGLLSLTINLAVMAFTAALGMGYFIMGVHRAADQPLRVTTLFECLPRMVPILLATLLSAVLTVLGLLVLILPGIYLVVAWYLAVPLVAERNLGVWRAMETSRRALTHHWFRAFGFSIAILLLNLVGLLCLVVGLVWTLPMSAIATGILYRNAFGVRPVASTA